MAERGQATSLAEQAYLRLRQDILICDLAPGQVVTERELAARYEMSKTPVREALTQVCHDGLVRRLPGRGYMVAPITVKDLRDLFDMRLILELAAADRVAAKAPALVIEQLQKLSTLSYDPADPHSHVQFLDGNRIFHLTLAHAAGNRRLTQTLEGLLLELDRYFHLGLRLRDSSEEMQREHEEVVEALQSGDAGKLRACIEAQVVASRSRILEAIMAGDLPSVEWGA